MLEMGLVVSILEGKHGTLGLGCWIYQQRMWEERVSFDAVFSSLENCSEGGFLVVFPRIIWMYGAFMCCWRRWISFAWGSDELGCFYCLLL
ncbi:hypothetical protein LINGRAHAP2_LOCUS11069 [Linum grandiflorum]